MLKTAAVSGLGGREEGGQCELRDVSSLNLKDWFACMRELSLHILDALENSLEAGANRIELIIREDFKADLLTVIVRDNGRGMSKDQLANIFDPFFTSRRTRHVGLGVPLFKAATKRCNGDMVITSQIGQGTNIQATFQHSHIDRAPLGNISGTLLAVILSGSCDVHYVHQVIGQDGDKEFEFDTAAIRSELGDVSLTHPSVREWLQDFVDEGEKGLQQLVR
jgi:hypothetical protein